MSRAIKVDLAAYKNVTHSFIITRWRQNVSALLHLPQFRPPKTPAWIAPDNRIMSEKHSGNFYMEATWGIPRSFVDERTPAECFSRGKFGGGYEDTGDSVLCSGKLGLTVSDFTEYFSSSKTRSVKFTHSWHMKNY